MNEILLQMLLASLIKSIKDPTKKEKIRPIAQNAVKGILLAYSDDPDFLDFLHE